MKPIHQGIRNLEGREPVGAVLSIGVKHSERGFPTETDRFHFVNPREENGIRAMHISFHSYNHAPADKRKIIHGNLVHATKELCFEYNLKAQNLPVSYYKGIGIKINAEQKSVGHPNRKPCCVGDGEKATRWIGPDADKFKEIECPHEKCEFRQTRPALCKPWMRFLFRIRWENGFADMPELLVKFTSGAWSTTSNIKGFFDYIETTAKNLGMQEYTLFGFPFVLSLAYQTKPSEKMRFPVVSISPEADPVNFFLRQRQNIRLLSSPAATPIAITDGAEQAVDVVYEDVKGISVSIPAQVGKPEKPPIPRKKEEKTGKVSKNDSASQDGRPTALKSGEQNGEHKNYPEDWPSQNEKIIAKGDISFQGISNKTLGEFIAGKDAQKKEWAIYEGFYRLDRAKKKFTAKNAVKEFCKIIEDADGDISKLDASFLGAKLEALTKAANNLE